MDEATGGGVLADRWAAVGGKRRGEIKNGLAGLRTCGVAAACLVQRCVPGV